MPIVLNHSVCLLLLIYAICDTAVIDKPITCDAGTFAPGQPAAVTCNLQAVDNASGLGVHMVRYRPGASEDDPGDSVLVCSWEKGSQSHHCDVEINGYKFCHNNSGVTVEIPSVRDEFAGLYICFLVPPDGIHAHACDLIVKGELTTSPQSTISPEKTVKQTGWMIGFVVVLISAVILMVAFGLREFFLRRRGAKRPTYIDDHVEAVRLIPVFRGNDCNTEQENLHETSVYPNPRLMLTLKHFLVGPEQFELLEQAVQKELSVYSTSPKNSNMFCTKVNAFPKKTETGDFLIMNLSSRWLQVLIVKLQGENINTDQYMTFRIPAKLKSGTSKQLIQFIADCVSLFLKSKELLHKRYSAGFVLCFPCKYKTEGDLTTARLTKWTKGFRRRNRLDKTWKELLLRALKKRHVCNLDIKAIVNDLVSLFMTGVREDEKCTIALVLGDGFGACYLQEGADQLTSGNETNSTEKMIICTESGALGEDGTLNELQTEFDRALDKDTVDPRKQILEKMISRLYLGDIVRLVLLKLIKLNFLFSTLYSKIPAFNKKGGFSTEHVVLIQSDTSEDHTVTRDTLRKLEVDPSNADDCKIVKYVCRIVYQRSAFLAAAVIAPLVKHVGQEEVTIAVDGSLYRSHPHYEILLKAKLRELVGPEYNVEFRSKPGATGIGAALTAAVSMTSRTDQETTHEKHGHGADNTEEPHSQI